MRRKGAQREREGRREEGGRESTIPSSVLYKRLPFPCASINDVAMGLNKISLTFDPPVVWQKIAATLWRRAVFFRSPTQWASLSRSINVTVQFVSTPSNRKWITSTSSRTRASSTSKSRGGHIYTCCTDTRNRDQNLIGAIFGP